MTSHSLNQDNELPLDDPELITQVLALSPVAITVLDAQGNIIQANRRAEQILGLTVSELLTMRYNTPIWQHMTLDGKPYPEDQQPFRRLKTHRQPIHNQEQIIRWPNGERKILLIDGAVLPSSPWRAVFTVQDITEQRLQQWLDMAMHQLMALIAEHHPQLGDILQTGVDLLAKLLWDVRLAVWFVKDRHLLYSGAGTMPQAYIDQVNGLPLQEVPGTCAQNARDPQQSVPALQALAEQFDFQGCWSQPITNPQGQVLGLLACYCRQARASAAFEQRAIVGITQILSLAMQSHYQLEQLETFFEKSNHALLLVDNQQQVRRANQQACSWFQYRLEELVGMNVAQLIPARFRAQHTQHIQRYQKSPEARPMGRGQDLSALRRDGSEFDAQVGLTPFKLGPEQMYLVTVNDITELKQSVQRLEQLAHYDQLTQLPNRRFFLSRLEAVTRPGPRSIKGFTLIMVDLDNFKQVNDSLGHAAGDHLLIEVARHLRRSIRKRDVVARLGGDEFALLLLSCTQVDATVRILQQLMRDIDQTIDLDGHHIKATVSMGVALYPRDGNDVGTLQRNADTALYAAKAAGRNTFQFYRQDQTQQAHERLFLEQNLRRAVLEQNFSLVYQPKLNLASGHMSGAEALLRWHHLERGWISPNQFIPIAEATRLINEIGLWVLRQTCRQGRLWLDQGLVFDQLAVNVSAIQIQRDGFVQEVLTVLEQTGLPAQHLELEVTEGFVMENTTFAIKQLNALRAHGITIALDDFGTGYSSLNYLKQLPIDRLKIDKMFIDRIPESPPDLAILQSILLLAHGLALDVVAEGVESATQRDFLKTQSCTFIQGYLYSKPLPAEIMTQRLQQAKQFGLDS
ncbi:MAG: EAL domain-containing protein [Methylococcales bacterium]|nr:EAL domain-containing protein [Methylococcales bacterium]